MSRLRYDYEATRDLLRQATNAWVRRGEIKRLADADWEGLRSAIDRTSASLAVAGDTLDLSDPASVERLAAALPNGAAYIAEGLGPEHLSNNERARLWVAAAIIAALREPLP